MKLAVNPIYLIVTHHVARQPTTTPHDFITRHNLASPALQCVSCRSAILEKLQYAFVRGAHQRYRLVSFLGRPACTVAWYCTLRRVQCTPGTVARVRRKQLVRQHPFADGWFTVCYKGIGVYEYQYYTRTRHASEFTVVVTVFPCGRRVYSTLIL